jgi:hypothetical protein
MIADTPPTHTCDSYSHLSGCGARKPYAPIGAPRIPSTPNSSDSFGHASVTTHAVRPGFLPVSPPRSDACPPQPSASGTSSTQNLNDKRNPKIHNCDSHSLATGSGAEKPLAPIGAPRHPNTLDLSDSLGNASGSTQRPPSGTCSSQNPTDNRTLSTPNSDTHPPRTTSNHPNSQQLPTSKEDTNRILPNDATSLSFAT